MLIDRLDADRAKFPSPVTSSNNDRVPTTGDVHLYADPDSLHSKAPLLYADCEGLDGGEAIPRGLRHRAKEREEPPPVSMLVAAGQSRSSRSTSSNRSSMFVESRKKLKRSRHGSERDIALGHHARDQEERVCRHSALSEAAVYFLRRSCLRAPKSEVGLLLTLHNHWFKWAQ